MATGTAKVNAQFPAWHVHGSPDNKYLAADDFDRNLWLIKADSGERRLLTQGHGREGLDIHPHASFTPDSRAVVFNSGHLGTQDVFLARLPEWDSLPTA